MDLKKNVFKQASAKKIAKSVLGSAKRSNRRKSSPKRSAMSMLSFYENRAGKIFRRPSARKSMARNVS
jgi:hypothetical protein